jgi:capsular polysaccharide biosynthesis protein
VVLLAALVAGILCSLLFAVLLDVRAGRLLERWQIEHILDRPILGEITLPRTESMGFE